MNPEQNDENVVTPEDIEALHDNDVEAAIIATTFEGPEEVAPLEIPEEETTEGVFTKFYAGQEVISEGTRTVNGKDYKHIRLLDGSTYDLTSEEYALQVTTE